MSVANSPTKHSVENTAESGIYARHTYIFLCQWLYHLTGRWVWYLLGRSRNVTLRYSDIEPGVHYVMAANHQNYLDPWILPASVPFRFWMRMGMPRAFIANRFFGYFFVGNLLRSVGGFPARQHATDPFGLDYAFSLMERGQSIMIFPEGGLSKKREKPAHRGIMVLAQQPSTKIIPVHLEWTGRGIGLRFAMVVGKPFDGSKMTAEEILKKIYSLPVNTDS